MISTQAETLIPNTLFELKLSILTYSVGTEVLLISKKTFLATDVLHNIAITVFVFLKSSINFKIIYSQISKLLAPVIASVPDNPLKFVFSGKLKFNSELVAQGGLPTTNTLSLLNSDLFILYLKKSSLMIRIFLS